MIVTHFPGDHGASACGRPSPRFLDHRWWKVDCFSCRKTTVWQTHRKMHGLLRVLSEGRVQA